MENQLVRYPSGEVPMTWSGRRVTGRAGELYNQVQIADKVNADFALTASTWRTV